MQSAIHLQNEAFGDHQNESPETIQLLPIDQLEDYPNQPFQAYSDDKLKGLSDDITLYGILSPLRVRPMGEGWQILAGHNRRNAAKMAGLTQAPCIVSPADDDTAALIVVNTNLNQREELLPSEKAFAYRMRLNAMKRRAGRPKENSGQVDRNLFGKESRDQLADEIGESSKQIQRYIRLTYLIPAFLRMVDEKTLSFLAGVNLSYHHEDLQRELHLFLELHEISKISIHQSEDIKNLVDMEEGRLLEIFGLAVDQKQRQTVRKGNLIGKKTAKVIEQRLGERGLIDEEVARIIDRALVLLEEQESQGDRNVAQG